MSTNSSNCVHSSTSREYYRVLSITTYRCTMSTNNLQAGLLTKQEYELIERAMGMAPTLPKDGTEAAYKLGIQYALKVIRENFTNGR